MAASFLKKTWEVSGMDLPEDFFLLKGKKPWGRGIGLKKETSSYFEAGVAGVVIKNLTYMYYDDNNNDVMM